MILSPLVYPGGGTVTFREEMSNTRGAVLVTHQYVARSLGALSLVVRIAIDVTPMKFGFASFECLFYRYQCHVCKIKIIKYRTLLLHISSEHCEGGVSF